MPLLYYVACAWVLYFVLFLIQYAIDFVAVAVTAVLVTHTVCDKFMMYMYILVKRMLGVSNSQATSFGLLLLQHE